MAKVKILEEKGTGEQIIPVTKAKAVFLGDGIDTVEAILPPVADKMGDTDTELETTAKTVVGAINEHESDIKEINDNLAKLSGLKYIGNVIAPGRSKTVTFAAGGARYVLVINSAATSARGVYLGSCTTAHVVSTTPVMNASDVTLSYGKDTLTVTAGNNSILADMYITSGNASVN